MTPPPGSEGGLLNAIVGSFIHVGLATLIGTPFGVLAGVYLAEYGRYTWLGRSTLFINDILLSAPSIVIGLFVYAVFVARVGHFSALAGIFALALLVIPVVIRTTENMLVLVPNNLREARVCLGYPKVESDYQSYAAGIGCGDHDGYFACGCQGFWRDCATAIYFLV
jgi:ABC-type phosphate transport system, permease component